MTLKFYGHSCFSIQTEGCLLLIDPFITGNPLASKVDIATLKPTHILLSHGHQDHILDAEAIAKASGAMLISNYEIATWYENKGVTNTMGMNFGGNFTFKDGTIKMVPALHSSQLPDGSYGGNPAGFIIKVDGETIYYAGDTGLSAEMDYIGKFERPTLAVLPIGDVFTMGVNDAILCSDIIQCNKVIGMHYNTFPPIEIDKNEAKRKFGAANKELILMDIEESLMF
ncbi:MAG: metal-dependent hydrolase [Flavobacteriales bacterium]